MQVRNRSLRRAFAALVLAGAGACTPRPEPIVYGEDVCTHCRMVIVDDRYSTELVTRTGLVHTFDSIECLADYVLGLEEPGSVHSLWVTSFQRPGELIAVEDAQFLHSEMMKSPMGANLTAFGKAEITARALVDSFGGEVLTWEEVLAYVRDHGHVHGAGMGSGSMPSRARMDTLPTAADTAASPDAR